MPPPADRHFVLLDMNIQVSLTNLLGLMHF